VVNNYEDLFLNVDQGELNHAFDLLFGVSFRDLRKAGIEVKGEGVKITRNCFIGLAVYAILSVLVITWWRTLSNQEPPYNVESFYFVHTLVLIASAVVSRVITDIIKSEEEKKKW